MRAYIRQEQNIGHTVCSCGRWWVTRREAIMDGWHGIDGVITCDYCRDSRKEEDDE